MSENMWVLFGIYLFVAVIGMFIAGSIFSEIDDNDSFSDFLFKWSIVVWAGTLWILILTGVVFFVVWMSLEYPMKDLVSGIKKKKEFDKKKEVKV